MTTVNSVQSCNEIRSNEHQISEDIKALASFIDQKVDDLYQGYDQIKFLRTLTTEVRAQISILPNETKQRLLTSITASAQYIFKAKGTEQELLSIAENGLIEIQRRLKEKIRDLGVLNLSMQMRKSQPTEAEWKQITDNQMERDWVITRSSFAEDMTKLDNSDWQKIQYAFFKAQFKFSKPFKYQVDALKPKL